MAQTIPVTITGTDLTGTDGGQNRTYQLSNTSIVAGSLIIFLDIGLYNS